MKHTHTLKNYQGSPEQLAEEIGDLFYDSLADVLHLLSEKLHRDANADLGRQRFKLGGHLKECSLHLERASREIQQAWQICELHVPPEYRRPTPPSVNDKRTERVRVAQETLDILQAGHYTNSQGERIDIATAIQQCQQLTRLYTPAEQLRLPPAHTLTTTLEVVNETTLAGAQRLYNTQQFQKIGVLNFASANHPGGGFLGGSQAQEESLARSSALYASLQQCPDYYAYHQHIERSLLYSDQVIYSPQCVVFRHDDGQLLDTPYSVDVITSAAPNRGSIARNEPESLSKINAVLAQRIARFLGIAAAQGCDALVLGAWGCGVFGNDPVQIAATFAAYLGDKGRYAHAFRHICFAIPANATTQVNLRAFELAFT